MMGTGNEGRWETGSGYRREREKEGEKERKEVCPQLQLLHPPVFAKQFHTVKAGCHRGKRVPVLLAVKFLDLQWGKCRWEDRGG